MGYSEKDTFPDSSMPLRALLEAKGVTKYYGGVGAIQDLDVVVWEGEALGMMGPNGAGKSTFVSIVSRLIPVDRGDIQLTGRSLLRLKPYQVVRLGVARTFQHPALFRSLSCVDNIIVGGLSAMRISVLLSTLPFKRKSLHYEMLHTEATNLLNKVGLSNRRDFKPSQLPPGEQRRLEIARALITRPQVLLLDEPSVGMNPKETSDLATLLRELNAQGLTLLIIEHNIPFLFSIADRIIVLDSGRKIAEGTPNEMGRHPDVQRAYFGKKLTAEVAGKAT